MEVSWVLVLGVCCAYIIGSIPFGILASRICGATDPRSTGSGNIGSTNVLRVSGKTAGILTLLGDLGKGLLVVVAAKAWISLEIWILLIAVAVIVGHIFSIFLGFRGGKGVATALGAIGGLELPIGLALIGIWLICIVLFKYSSGAAIAAFGLFPLMAIGFSYSVNFIIFSLFVSSLVILRHWENILRLLSGQEGRIDNSSS